MEPKLVKEFAELAVSRGWRFFVMYGQTEASPRMSYVPPDMVGRYPNCIGMAIPGGELRLIDADGREISKPDEAGELCYRGPNVMIGYADSVADLATSTALDELRTGDIGCRNEAGLYYVVGRTARFVKPFGVRIGLDDLERYLSSLGLVAACTGSDDCIVVAIAGEDVDSNVGQILAEKLRLPLSHFELFSRLAFLCANLNRARGLSWCCPSRLGGHDRCPSGSATSRASRGKGIAT